MEKRNKFYLFILIAIILLISVLFVLFYEQNKQVNVSGITPSVTKQINSYSYEGIEGKNALEILKEKTKIEQAASGLVIAINGRKANEEDREFWAFIVNGKEAQVGPADYQTKKGDLIEWKIQNY